MLLYINYVVLRQRENRFVFQWTKNEASSSSLFLKKKQQQQQQQQRRVILIAICAKSSISSWGNSQTVWKLGILTTPILRWTVTMVVLCLTPKHKIWVGCHSFKRYLSSSERRSQFMSERNLNPVCSFIHLFNLSLYFMKAPLHDLLPRFLAGKD